MGLLDDAIREHLDLKRRRGADPSEIERAEREALGPVRRGPEPAPAGEEPVYEEEPAAYDETGAAYDFGDEPRWDEPFEVELDDRRDPSGTYSEAPPPEPLAPPEPLPPEATAEPPLEHPAPQFEPSRAPERQQLDDPFADDPFAESDAMAPPPHAAPEGAGESIGGETVEYRIEDALDDPADSAHPRKPESDREGEPGHPPDREDVLEETPEFLQDTPDHDRLWFEQRPPRDFDFDG